MVTWGDKSHVGRHVSHVTGQLAIRSHVFYYTWKTVTSDHRRLSKFLRSHLQPRVALNTSWHEHGRFSVRWPQNLPPNKCIPRTLHAEQKSIDTLLYSRETKHNYDVQCNNIYIYIYSTMEEHSRSLPHDLLKATKVEAAKWWSESWDGAQRNIIMCSGCATLSPLNVHVRVRGERGLLRLEKCWLVMGSV